ncbi:MAG: D-alanyl-D-alanine carboxypeptidase, partial [Desulfobacteraceae bacterium]
TPLLPFALSKAKSSGLKEGRILLAGNREDSIYYAGELIRYFLRKSGIKVAGKIRRGEVQPKSDHLLLHHLSPDTLDQVIAHLMEFSNNYIANQLLLTAGATALGSPGTLKKGVKIAATYAREYLGLKHISIVEGSGLSRQNRISASAMIELLKHFEPYYQLLRHENKEFYKTGTLNNVRSRAGYLEGDDGRRYPFVVLINTPEKSTKPAMQIFRQIISLLPKNKSNQFKQKSSYINELNFAVPLVI